MSYTFGDTDLAARRLALVAETFDAPSRAFLEAMKHPGALALDLGCGPGHTTQLVSETSGCARCVGLELSDPHLAAARRNYPQLAFERHDLTAVPFPTGPADLVYARYLLTHLAEPGAVLARWGSQLRPGGRLLVDDLESIDVPSPVLGEYLGIVEAMLADQGQSLYVGAGLDALDEPPGLRRLASAVRHHAVPVARAATLFGMNLAVWRETDFARRLDPARLDALRDGLRDLADRGEAAGTATWGLRQIAFEG